MFSSTFQNLQIAVRCKLTMLTILIGKVNNDQKEFDLNISYSPYCYTSFETNIKRSVVFLTVNYCVNLTVGNQR
jgi:hypothetical protein